MINQATSTAAPQSGSARWLRWANLAFMLYLLLLAVSMVGSGFKWATGEHAKTLFEFASHPVAGLMIGLVATALIQSSSTVTSIIVGLVAGGLPVATAIPMIMGANIGTTVTNTLVSLGHVRCKDEFKRAFASATIHDFFNLLAVIIFLPLEMMFGILEKVSHWLISPMLATGDMSIKGFNFIKPITKPVVSAIKEPLATFGDVAGGVTLILLGIATIFVAITVMGKLMKSLMVGRAREILKNAIGRGPLHGIASGSVVTVLVQSSSTTTSLMVPLVGSGVLKVRDVYPFTLGANIGTCITALLAATAVSGEFAVFALQIALVHLVFNLMATIFIYGIPFLRELPIKGADLISDMAMKNKAVVVGYLLAVFIIMPGTILALTA
ncbi:putative Sodium-dependent phosphate transporter [Vibrio nigripulchritudo MADA3029]|uniref:Sodium-dependent phosphate transporter n=2 Tax=Vibrio nigripulchritudo TaxID=28173 RepID=A0AAV2VQF5_9VIBR|nr:NptA protein [Vibrio nigripulchritudo ATCC 27043]CCN38393.1 putative Sodium-dependent phosphate transporter [Vibrio nigripulchritudo AM115]CCN41316.1 putative Sodium-dependent phosphate transporter [Vibrio nigripulchritudo FTn2]CCN48016.1 putative Sodium-dependent phosphate transporter [Vibrio nigripulchritudo MADA3020]CCN53112.1 putative Sodium-dependent phosphate transporter [Vibrio nigripulchritudo MADA3021]CCN57880.1 putative Sodium-dependent phosphate transporter [Vibrio nigripulchritu